MMKYSKIEQKLLDAMGQMDIIDCHEHLPPEQVRLESPQDVFTLFSHYTRYDLISAGMSEADYKKLFDYDVPLEQRWASFRPFWEAIRYGSYAKAALLAGKMVYGFDDINDRTYHPLSEAIAAANTPGIYQRILCDRCRIRAVLTQCRSTAVQGPLVPLMPGWSLTEVYAREQLEDISRNIAREIPKDVDGWVDMIGAYLSRWIDEGAVGIKITSRANLPPDRKAANAACKRLLGGDTLVPDANRFGALDNYLKHQMIDMAASSDLVIAVHAGIWDDFRNDDCKHMLTLAPAHPEARFDLYHLGMPSVRDCIVIGKNHPNVYLNLAWTHVISQVQTRSGLDELLDQVPVNKILAFGGDYNRPVEKVVGHLQMAREDFAIVFARRIDSGQMSFDEAMEILQLWFWDNPLRLYTRLDVR